MAVKDNPQFAIGDTVTVYSEYSDRFITGKVYHVTGTYISVQVQQPNGLGTCVMGPIDQMKPVHAS